MGWVKQAKNLPASSAVYWFSGIYLGGKIALYQKLLGFMCGTLGRFFRRLADFSGFDESGCPF
ncbi:MAG: hypothetical protein QNJ63_21100 [Calothrix sp. MO_192.B10]|nr:hypothetical protein [Calothrix sp. MO_192.B10]